MAGTANTGGYSIAVTPGREQPYTVWCMREVVAFTRTYRAALAVIRRDWGRGEGE